MKEPTEHKICTNCGHQVDGLYCANCGQMNNVGRLKWATLAESFLATFIGDGAIGDKRSNIRYGFLFTLWSIVTRPGQTVEEFLEGRRRKYFNPVTILLLLSGFYALVGVFFGVIKDTPSPSKNLIGQYANAIMAYFESHPATLYLVILPFTALAYKWLFRKYGNRRYIEFAYIGIFGAIFSMTLLLFKLPFRSAALEEYSSYVIFAVFIAQGWFAVAVFRKLFRVSVKRGIWKWLLSLVISYSLFFLVMFILLVLAIAAYYLIDLEGFKETIGDFSKSVGNPTKDAIPATDSLRMQ